MKIKGTQTEKNLLAAFAGESQARNRYTYFAAQARKDGFDPDRRHLRGDGQPGEGAREALLQPAPGRRGGDHRGVPGRRDRHHAGEPEGRGGGRARRVDRHSTRASPRSPGRRASTAIASSSSRSPSPRSSTRSATWTSRATSRPGPGLQEGQAGRLALPQLRLPPRGPRGARGLPGLRPSAGPLRAARRELVVTPSVEGTGPPDRPGGPVFISLR